MLGIQAADGWAETVVYDCLECSSSDSQTTRQYPTLLMTERLPMCSFRPNLKQWRSCDPLFDILHSLTAAAAEEEVTLHSKRLQKFELLVHQ